MEVLADGLVAGGALPADAWRSIDGGLALLMDELAHGMLVVALDGRVHHANQAALHEFARRRVLFTRHDVLHACTQEAGKTLHDALLRAGQGKRSLVELPAAEGPALTLATVPLKPQPASQAPRAAVFFSRATVCDPVMLCFFSRTHHLTSAEEQVLAILCQGFSAPQVAVQLKVAVSTVRSHIRSLCAKTRSSGVRDLVTRLAVLPPVAPPFWHEPMH